ncbi:MAG: pentapeptide repeat-containing protein [Thermoguttaceae bacterium]
MLKKFSVLLVFIIVQICMFCMVPLGVYAQYAIVNGKPVLLEDDLDLSRVNMTYTRIVKITDDTDDEWRPHGELRNVNFACSDLSNSSMSDMRFIGCSFRSATLVGVVAIPSEFIDCDFTDAKVWDTRIPFTKDQLVPTTSFKQKSLIKCCLAGDYSNTDFSGFALNEVDFFDTTTLAGSDFSDATIGRLNGGINVRHSYIGCDFSMKQLYSTASYKNGELANIDFAGIDFSSADLSKMNISGCSFRGAFRPISKKCNFQGADLTDSVICRCDFSLAENLTVDQIKSTWNYKVGRMEGIKLPPDIADALEKEKTN